MKRLPKWLICKATRISHYQGGTDYYRYGWRVLGLFIEDGRRDWEDSTNNEDEVYMQSYPPPLFF